MEADTNSVGNKSSFELDISVGLLLGNQSAHETVPHFTNNEEENQEAISSENRNGGMSNTPSDVVDDPSLLQLDLGPPPNTPAPATEQEVPMGLQNAALVDQFQPQQDVNWINPNINQFNAQPPQIFQPQPMAPVNHNPALVGDQQVQLSPMYPRPQMLMGEGAATPWMNQQQPVPNEPWLSLNFNSHDRPGPQNLPNNQLYDHQVHGTPIQNVYEPHHSHQFMAPVTHFHHGPPPTQHQQHLQYHNSVPNSMLPWYQQSFHPTQPPPLNQQMSLSTFLATPFNPRQFEQNGCFQFQQIHPTGGQDTGINENIQLPFPIELDTEPLSTNRKRRERMRLENGESSSSSHKHKWRRTQESNQSQRTERNNDISQTRVAKNAVYDPLFATIGIPVDPHLRQFSLYH